MSKLREFVGSMTVAQLAEIAGMEVESLVAAVLRKSARPEAQRSRPAASPSKARVPAATPSRAAGGPNTRTQEGRAAFDAAIVSFLSTCSEPVRAVEVRREVGGTSAQVRTRLNALIEGGHVTFTGQASGTRYSVRA